LELIFEAKSTLGVQALKVFSTRRASGFKSGS
jgi:hypothetical protein